MENFLEPSTKGLCRPMATPTVSDMKMSAEHQQEHQLRKRVAALALVAVAVVFTEPFLIHESTPVAPVTERR